MGGWIEEGEEGKETGEGKGRDREGKENGDCPPTISGLKVGLVTVVRRTMSSTDRWY